jgi:hypothetical protein
MIRIIVAGHISSGKTIAAARIAELLQEEGVEVTFQDYDFQDLRKAVARNHKLLYSRGAKLGDVVDKVLIETRQLNREGQGVRYAETLDGKTVAVKESL